MSQHFPHLSDLSAAGRFFLSVKDFGKRAKRLADLCDVPLSRTQQGLALLYGFGNYQEAITVLSHPGVQHGPFSDVHLADPAAWAYRDQRALALAMDLVGSGTDSPVFDLVASLGLFDSPLMHAQLYRDVRAALNVEVDSSWEDAEGVVDYLSPQGDALNEFGRGLLNHLIGYVRQDAAEHAHQLHALAMRLPNAPWAQAAALIAHGDAAPAGPFTTQEALNEERVRAWRLRLIATNCGQAYDSLHASYVDPYPGEDIHDLRQDELYTWWGLGRKLAGRALLAIGDVRGASRELTWTAEFDPSRVHEIDTPLAVARALKMAGTPASSLQRVAGPHLASVIALYARLDAVRGGQRGIGTEEGLRALAVKSMTAALAASPWAAVALLNAQGPELLSDAREIERQSRRLESLVMALPGATPGNRLGDVQEVLLRMRPVLDRAPPVMGWLQQIAMKVADDVADLHRQFPSDRVGGALFQTFAELVEAREAEVLGARAFHGATI